ncbi:MAG: cysteine--tRNA ligase [Aestuariivita sp.]|nr:cysteine--tRNA ligase [Aestuariivita sp.]
MNTIKLTNSKTRQKEFFTPINSCNVRMYVCGPTVYDRAHIGNARPVVVFDVLYRLLRYVYGSRHVSYVRNITDIDDKIIDRAVQAGIEIDELTSKTLNWFHEDMAALGVDYRNDPQFFEPRATEYISEMLAMIEELIKRRHAYVAKQHVLFSVESFQDYGSLSGRSTEDMIAGARVEVAPFKQNSMDFVLWKPSNNDQPGWESPWGRGRPGWHIECSAMSHALLGETFDIHGGGSDLIFPHHENEIAQSRCFCPKGDFARYWLHNEMLQVDGKKMAKSVGNFFTVRDLLNQSVPGEVIRFVLLSTHYRKPMNWTKKKADEAMMTLRKWRNLTSGIKEGRPPENVVNALADDLNTSRAVAELHRLAAVQDGPSLKAGAMLLGLLHDNLGHWYAPKSNDIDEILVERIEFWINQRNLAKIEKNYARADAIRHKLSAVGVAVLDTVDGVKWAINPAHENSGKWELLE